MKDNKDTGSHAHRDRVWFKSIAILGALWLAVVLPIAPSADGSETHGGPIKPNSAAIQIVASMV